MRERQLEIDSIGPGLELLMPSLRGRVFHVTSIDAWQQILKAGGICPNTDARFETGFGSARNSFFRKRGCVSLWDFRTATDEQIESALCHPLQIVRYERPGVVLILSPAIHASLISWIGWEQEKVYSEMVVPHIECGHPGAIPLSAVEEAVTVRVTTPPRRRGSLEDLLARSYRDWPEKP
jgi:hypothetical protein